MFQLTTEEAEDLVSQNVIPSRQSLGGSLPYAFTEQGVAMLSAVLKSQRAVQVSIQIVRTFTKLREMLSTYKELREKLEQMEKRYDKNFRVVFQLLDRLMTEETKPTRQIGFGN